MDPISIGAALMPVAGAIIGNNAAARDRNAAEQARRDALAQFAGIDIPSIEDQRLALETYLSGGTLDPEMERQILLGNTALEGVNIDPRLRQEQMSALESIAGLASGQPSSGDLAGFELARRQAAGEAQAKQAQILQEMQSRGQGGSGAELLARLTSAQASSDQLSNAGLQQAQAMQQARLAALQQQSNMAGNLRGQDYSEAANLAKARDAVAQFNAQNAQNLESRNIANRNNAAAANLAQAQQLANANVDTRNRQQIHNRGLAQTQFGNQMNLAGARAGQYGGMAGAAERQAANTAGMWANIGQGVGTALTGFRSAGTDTTGAKKVPANAAGQSYYDPSNIA